MARLWLLFLIGVMVLYTGKSFSQVKDIQKLQKKLDSLVISGNFPGLSLAIAYPDNTVLELVSGYSDMEKKIPLKVTDRLLQGSVGKTYVSTIALQLIGQQKLSLDDKVSKYLGHFEWFDRLPNAPDITIRMLMNHTSGIMRYEFKQAFTDQLTAHPDKVWKPEELVSFVLGERATFKAGEGWDYSDTNYILLGMIIESITKKKLYTLIDENILKPYKLTNTLPSDKRKLAGLAQGYAGGRNSFGGKDKMIGEDGKFVINPQFEWAGGGFYSTTSDLAKWGKLLFEGKIFNTSLLTVMLDGVVASQFGREARYGLGVLIRKPAVGIAQGHSGFFPGYLTEMYYFPGQKICIAIQSNSSDFSSIKMGVWRCVLEMIAIL